jgi:hypothetical protein
MEAIWGKHTKNAYRWLKAHSDQGHIGWMDEGEVKAVIVQLEELLHG